MAPEYALWGQLSEKADVYSFGIVAMEIVSGQSNTKQKGSADHVSLINWVTEKIVFCFSLAYLMCYSLLKPHVTTKLRQ